ncbi:hypothetical protein [Palleronia sp. LCG004]|nr:hypothetical protein [Palleronia sp. LCG004]WOI57929.1 hypothetical protein RVY76_15095 [Palleronia sp. LCG004]
MAPPFASGRLRCLAAAGQLRMVDLRDLTDGALAVRARRSL